MSYNSGSMLKHFESLQSFVISALQCFINLDLYSVYTHIITSKDLLYQTISQIVSKIATDFHGLTTNIQEVVVYLFLVKKKTSYITKHNLCTEFLSKKDECRVYYTQQIYHTDNRANEILINDERDNFFKQYIQFR